MVRSLLQDLQSLDTTRRSLRSFGLVVGGVAILIAAWIFWRSGSFGLWNASGIRPVSYVGFIGLVLILLAFVWPRPLRPLYYVWMAIALILGFAMTRVILTIVFVLLIVPMGVFMRLLGRDPLSRRRDASEESYWISRQDMDRTPERLERYY